VILGDEFAFELSVGFQQCVDKLDSIIAPLGIDYPVEREDAASGCARDVYGLRDFFHPDSRLSFCVDDRWFPQSCQDQGEF